MKKLSLAQSLLICFSGYLFAFTLVILLCHITGIPRDMLMATLVYDLMATFLIFLFSLTFNNSSLYDPYWSLAPLPIILTWVRQASLPGVNQYRQWIIITLTIAWSARLTFNWIRRWKGLGDEDWRYARFRSFSKPMYWLISLTGFHVFPTLTVFAGCLSVYPALCLTSQPLTITDGIAALISLSGIAVEMIADRQLTDFLRVSSGKTFLSKGLWRYSRHPNYFGEILWWTGLFVFSLRSRPFYWYTLTGPLAMILMFSLISIPMMDKRMMERKPGYEEYARRTSALIPWWRK